MNIRRVISGLLRLSSRLRLPRPLVSQLLDVDAAIVIENKERPVILRLRIGGSGFLELLIEGDALSFGALGTGVEGSAWPGDLSSLPKIYPGLFPDGVYSYRSKSDTSYSRDFAAQFQEWHGRQFKELADPPVDQLIEDMTEVFWIDAAASHSVREPSSNWCVPTSMAILTQGLYAGGSKPPDYFAQRWGQPADEWFYEDCDRTVGGQKATQYDHLLAEAADVGVWERIPRKLTSIQVQGGIDVQNWKAATLVAQVNHAEVIVASGKIKALGDGADLIGYLVASPTDRVTEWRQVDLHVRFALSRP